MKEDRGPLGSSASDSNKALKVEGEEDGSLIDVEMLDFADEPFSSAENRSSKVLGSFKSTVAVGPHLAGSGSR